MRKLAAVFSCALLLTACSGQEDGDGVGTQPADPTQSAASSSTAKVVDISIKDGKVTPQGKRVEVTVDQPIVLRVTTDSDDEVHVHSEAEHEYEVAPGPTQEFTFTIDTPGQIAVESHHLDVTIVQLVVRP